MSTAARTGRVPPGPPRRAAPTLLRRLATDRLGLLSDAAKTYGDAARIRIGPKTLYFFNHPDHAKHVLADNSANYRKGIGYIQARRALGDGLLTSDGERWRRQRKTVQPVFQQKRIAAQADVVAAESAKLVDRLRVTQGARVDVLDELTKFTLGVLGRTLLESDLEAFGSIGTSFEDVQDQAMFEMESMGLVPTWLPLPRQLRFRKARADLRRIVDTLAGQRRASWRAGAEDVLTRLIKSVDEVPDPAEGRKRLHDELITLLLAGHETTASTVGWTFHAIQDHPDVLDRLHREAVEVLGDRPPEYADLHRLTYTSMVIQEVIRLHPPVWILPRQAVADDEVGGYHVPAGSDVLICPYTMHRNPAFWPQPERFDPERFDPNRAVERPRYAHLPFGAGPRVCVGSQLGLMEATFVVAMISRAMRLRAVPGSVVRPEPMLSLRLGGGLPMTVHPVEAQEAVADERKGRADVRA